MLLRFLSAWSLESRLPLLRLVDLLQRNQFLLQEECKFWKQALHEYAEFQRKKTGTVYCFEMQKNPDLDIDELLSNDNQEVLHEETVLHIAFNIEDLHASSSLLYHSVARSSPIKTDISIRISNVRALQDFAAVASIDKAIDFCFFEQVVYQIPSRYHLSYIGEV